MVVEVVEVGCSSSNSRSSNSNGTLWQYSEHQMLQK